MVKKKREDEAEQLDNLDVRPGWNVKKNVKNARYPRYAAAIWYAGGPIVFSLVVIVVGIAYPFIHYEIILSTLQTDFISGVYLILSAIFTGGVVAIGGVIALVISVQFAIFCEPPGGVIYKNVEPIWQATIRKLIDKVKMAVRNYIHH